MRGAFDLTGMTMITGELAREGCDHFVRRLFRIEILELCVGVSYFVVTALLDVLNIRSDL